jgi:acyl-CoA hydrolase
VGNHVQCSAELTYVGRTSMEVRVEVLTEDVLTGEASITNTAYLVYVALDGAGRPTPVPRLSYLTEAERDRAAQAEARQQYRKQQRAREEQR